MNDHGVKNNGVTTEHRHGHDFDQLVDLLCDTPHPSETLATTDDPVSRVTLDLKARLHESNGECIFSMTEDYGNRNTSIEREIQLLHEAANALNCTISKIGETSKPHFLIRETRKDKYIDLRVAVCGNVDAGKSTLVGVLTSGILDDGRGSARAAIFTHKHEIETGRTSCIGEQILGFDTAGNCINQHDGKKAISWGTVIDKSYKVVSFIDLAGHERYLKTTVSGLTGLMPDYALLLVGANMGITRMTKEHFGLILALKIPVIVIVTKIDMAPENVKNETIQEIHRILKMKGVKKLPVHVRNDEDLLTVIKTVQNDRIVPIFEVSSVTGENMDLLRKFFNIIPPRIQWDLLGKNSTEVVIDQAWSIPGVGTVVGGTVTGGIVKEGQTLLLGPDKLGNFKPVSVKSLHTNRVPVKEIETGKSAGIALKKVRRSEFRRGMVLVDPSTNPVAVREFQADVVILHHSTSIKKNYEPVIQCMTLRQAARIVDLGGKDILRTGDQAKVTFRFCYHPEFVKPGMRIIFREGRCKGIGIVSSVSTSIGEKVNRTIAATTTTATDIVSKPASLKMADL